MKLLNHNLKIHSDAYTDADGKMVHISDKSAYSLKTWTSFGALETKLRRLHMAQHVGKSKRNNFPLPFNGVKANYVSKDKQKNRCDLS